MAADLQLALRIRADVNAARSEIRTVADEVRKLGAGGPAAARGLAQVDQSAQRTARSASALTDTARQLRGVLAGIGASISARELVQAADTYQLLEGRLRLVTRSSEELRAVEERLFESAQATRSGYAETVELYARVARNAAALGASQADLLQVTETVNQAIQVSGASAAEAAGGVIQFSQALASGELRGEELRSVMESMPRLAQAIAAGLGEIGVGANLTIGDLRRLAEAGELTSDRIFRALLTQAGTLRQEFGALPRTVGGAMTQLANDVQRALAQADMQPLIAGIDGVREALTDPSMLEAIKFFGSSFAQSVQLALIPLREAGRLLAWFRQQRDFAAGEGAAAASGDPDRIQARIAQLRQQIDDAANFPQLAGSRRSQAELDALRKEILRLEQARRAAVAGRAAAAPDLTAPPPPSPPSSLAGAGKGGDSAAADAAQKRADAIAKLVESLREEAQTMGLTAEQTALYRLRQLGASDATLAGAQVLADHIARLREQETAEKAAADAARQRAEEIARAQEADRELLEGMAEELRLSTLTSREQAQQAAARRLSAEATDEQRRAVEALAGALYDQQQAAKDTGDEMSEFATQAARNIQDAFADFLFDPFSEGLDGMLFGFVQTLRRMASEAIAARIGESLFGDLLKSGAGAAAGGGDNGLLGGLLAGLFHTGGVAGVDAAPARRVPAVMYALAPRYHGGGIAGLAPDEVPAVLRRGEEVLTANDPRHRNNGGLAPQAAPVVQVRNINLFDTQAIGDYLGTSAGEKVVLNIVSRNKAALGLAR